MSLALISSLFCRPNWLVERYGPKKYSKNEEELIIRDFFHDKRDGYFVDIGAGHYRIHSNTYFLEKDLGWQGLAVDANCQYGKEYAEFRPKTRFFCFFVGVQSGRWMDFYIQLWNKRLSTGVPDWTKNAGLYRKTRIMSITLDDLLARAGVVRFDFLSMDIELGEPAALSGFNIGKHRPALVCIEAHRQVRKEILRFFSQNGYGIVGIYETLDPLNLYFAPEPSSDG